MGQPVAGQPEARGRKQQQRSSECRHSEPRLIGEEKRGDEPNECGGECGQKGHESDHVEDLMEPFQGLEESHSNRFALLEDLGVFIDLDEPVRVGQGGDRR